MTEREKYDKFVEKFNKWAEKENNMVLEAANKMGIQKPVIKEKILTYPKSDVLFNSTKSIVEIMEDMRKSEIMGKEQMLTMDLTRNARKEGVVEFIDALGDSTLSAKIRKMDNYQIQALITKGVVPTYIPYVDEGRYTDEELIATVERDGYDIGEIINTIRGE